MYWWKSGCCAVVLVLAATFVHGAEPAPAENEDDTPAWEERGQESRRLLEEVLMARLTRELALDEEQTVLMVRYLAEFRDKMASMRRERLLLARALRQAVRESKDEAVIGKLLEEIIAHDETTALARQEILEFKGFELTTWQRAKLFLFLHDFEGDMRRLLKQAQERRLMNSRRLERGEALPSDEPARREDEVTAGEDTQPVNSTPATGESAPSAE